MGKPGDQPQYHFHTQSSHINSSTSGILLLSSNCLSSPSSIGGNSIGDLVNLGESAEWIFQSIGQSRGENPRSWHESQSCQLRHSTTPSGTGTNHKGLVQSYLIFNGKWTLMKGRKCSIRTQNSTKYWESFKAKLSLCVNFSHILLSFKSCLFMHSTVVENLSKCRIIQINF